MLRLTPPANISIANNLSRYVRSFTSYHSPLLEKALPPRPKIDENELEESFLKGSGPGGQKINKTASAVQIKHLPTGIVVKCQETRSRQTNRKFARRILAEKLDQLEKGDQSRMAIKTERIRAKKASANKKTRRKYKKLAEEKDGKDSEEGEIEPREVEDASEEPVDGLLHSELESVPKSNTGT